MIILFDIGAMDMVRESHFIDAGIEPNIEDELRAERLLYSNLSPEQIAMRQYIEGWKREGLA